MAARIERRELPVKKGGLLQLPTVRIGRIYARTVADNGWSSPGNNPDHQPFDVLAGSVAVLRRSEGTWVIHDNIDGATSADAHAKRWYIGAPFSPGESARLIGLVGSSDALMHHSQLMEATIQHGEGGAFFQRVVGMLRQLERARDPLKVAARDALVSALQAQTQWEREEGLQEGTAQLQARHYLVEEDLLPGVTRRHGRLGKHRTWCDLVVSRLSEHIELLLTNPILQLKDGETPRDRESALTLRREVQQTRTWLESKVLPRPYFKHMRRAAAEFKLVGAHLINRDYGSARTQLQATLRGLKHLSLRRANETVRDHLLQGNLSQEIMGLWVVQLMGIALALQNGSPLMRETIGDALQLLQHVYTDVRQGEPAHQVRENLKSVSVLL